MDLVDLIEKRRFVGREFLVWLWFESELFEGQLDIKGVGPCQLTLESQITLVQEKEQSQLKGATPSANPEAREALRQGKTPTRAKARMGFAEFEYTFVFAADSMAISAVKIPAVVKKDEGDEQFYERMYLIEELESRLGALYAEFLALRLSKAWASDVAPAIRAWAHEEPGIDPAAYRKIKSKVAPIKAAPKAADASAPASKASSKAPTPTKPEPPAKPKPAAKKKG